MLMAWTALFKTELLALTRSWVLRGWLIALAVTEFFTLTIGLMGNRVAPVPASGTLASILNLFLFAWSIVIIVLGAGSVSLESDVISDSILSRPCTRTQFISAKFASRTLVVLGVYLVSALVAGVTAWRYGANDMTAYTIATGVGVVGLAVLLLLSLGITFSVIFNNTVTAVASLMLVWYVASPIFGFLGADYLSPFSIARNLPRMLKDPNAPQLADGQATQTGVTLSFSKPLEPQSAEQPGNYVIESPEGTAYSAQSAVYDKPKNSVVLAGLTLPAGGKLKVTVRNVSDAGGMSISPAANSVDIDVPADASEHTGTQQTTVAGVATPPSAGITSAAGRGASTSGAAPVVKKPGADRSAPRVLQCTATAGSVKVTFSTALNSKEAETIQNYTVESPQGKTHLPRIASYSPAAHTVLLSGFDFAADDPVKVTVKDVHSADGIPISTRNNTATYAELTTWKYVVGLGLPSLTAFFIAIFWFARRDL